jgi:hypothetical protein
MSTFAVTQGIVGDTYDRFIAGEAAVSDPESQLYLPPDVRLPSLSISIPFQTLKCGVVPLGC